MNQQNNNTRPTPEQIVEPRKWLQGVTNSLNKTPSAEHARLLLAFTEQPTDEDILAIAVKNANALLGWEARADDMESARIALLDKWKREDDSVWLDCVRAQYLIVCHFFGSVKP